MVNHTTAIIEVSVPSSLLHIHNSFTKMGANVHIRVTFLDRQFIPSYKNKKDEQGIIMIESGIPTSKSLNNDRFLPYINYMLTHLKTLLTFYGFYTAKSRFNLYQGFKEHAINIYFRLERQK